MPQKPTYEDLEKKVRELEQAELKRKQTEEELARIFSMSLDMICIADMNTTTFIKVNPAFTEILGHSEKELLEKPFLDFVHPDDIDKTRTVIEQKLKSGARVINFENRYRCKDGSYRWLSWVSHPKPEQGVTYAVAHDITERKQNEEELKKNKELLDATGRMAKVGGWELDADSMEVAWTKETYRIHEVPFDYEPTLQEAINFFHPEHRPQLKQAIERALEHGEPYDMEILFITGKGKTLWTRTICKPEIVDGKTVKLKGTFQDITKRRQLIEDLKESRQQLELVIQGSRDGFWDWDIVTGDLYLSPRWHEQLGYETGDVVPKIEALKAVCHPEDYPRVMEVIQRQIDGESDKPYEMEHRFKTKSGDWKWILARGMVIRDDENRAVRMIGTTTDITDRKAAEREALILKTAIDQVPVGIALADEEINIYYCNPEGLGMRGGKIDDLVEIPKSAFKNWRVYRLNGEPYEIDNLPLVRAIKTGVTIREDFIVKHQDGSSRICDAFACPVIENNKIIGGIVIFLDITDRKQAEEKIIKNEERLHNLLEAIQAGVVVHDTEKSRVVKFNPAALKLLGLTKDQILGRSTAEPGWGFVHENGVPMRVDEYPVNIVKRTKQPLLDYIVGITKPSESEPTWALINATPQFDSYGSLSEIIISSMDITELKITQSQLREKTEQLMQAQKLESIGNLAGGIAHDFNNILSSIIGFTELAIEDAPRDSDLENSLHQVLSAGKRAKDLVTQILTFARKTNEEKKSVSIDKIAKESLKLLRSSIPTDIEIEQHVNSDATVVGNPSLLQQVILNISGNAADAMEDGGGLLKVTVSDIAVDERFASDHDLPRPGDYVRIIISDTGIGISRDAVKSIFEPYFTTKKQGKGTGLGLATVYGTVKKYGGAVNVESCPGKGTEFTVFLPASPKSEVVEPDEPDELPGGKERILLVDDETPIVKLGKQLLERLGYRVVALTSSIEALKLFRAKPDDFDLVLTDMAMPNLSGDKLAIEIMKIRRDIPVILCTGYSKKIFKKTAEKIGIRAFAYKPMLKADLARTVRKVLDEAKSAS